MFSKIISSSAHILYYSCINVSAIEPNSRVQFYVVIWGPQVYLLTSSILREFYLAFHIFLSVDGASICYFILRFIIHVYSHLSKGSYTKANRDFPIRYIKAQI